MDFDRVALPTLISQFLHDGTALARAEFALFRAKLSARLTAAKSGAILLVVAIVLATLALIALTMGCVLALATLIGPGLAGLAVFAALLLVAAVFGWLGAKQIATKPDPIVDRVMEGSAA